jgi:hypothetical protein
MEISRVDAEVLKEVRYRARSGALAAVSCAAAVLPDILRRWWEYTRVAPPTLSDRVFGYLENSI